jgi:hypothetical protein
MTYPRWRYFPTWGQPPEWAQALVDAVTESQENIERTRSTFEDPSASTERSNAILACLRPALERLGYQVERGKRRDQKIYRPVFFEDEGKVTKSFDVDAFHPVDRIGVEVEYGRTQPNNAVYKDLIELCLMIDVDFGALFVPTTYRTRERPYDYAVNVFQPIFASPRLNLPLKGLLLVGY